jgi:outer membrane protein assembly factor BamB
MTRTLSGSLLLCLALTQATNAENWPRFRGENGTGVSDQKGLPVTWSDGNYAWSIVLPGMGHSAPIIWDDNLFVTSAEPRGLTRYILCLNPADGKEKWRISIPMSDSHKHNKSSWASSTPVTDGKLLYVAFADVEDYIVNAYDFDGKLVWRTDVGGFHSQHNLGVSLTLFEDTVIVPNDQRGPARIVALDKHTGDLRWSTLRLQREVSYATPVVVPDAKGDPQLICVSGRMGITSLDPYSGTMNWQTRSFPLRTVASPVYGAGLLIASCGQGGRYGVEQIAVDINGDLGEDGLAKIVWQRKKVIPYVPTPIVYDGHLYEWSDEGIVACVELKTGKDIWTERIGGNYSGSPLCIDGKIYCMSESGEVQVVGASPEFKHYGTTPLGDPSNSTPAVANGRLFLRSFHRLACLEAEQ